MENEQNNEQAVDLNTMLPIEEAQKQYLKEIEKESKQIIMEQKQQRTKRVSEINNTISKILKAFGWCIIIFAFIFGIILGNGYAEYDEDEFNVIVMLITWLAGFISSILFFSLGEIIQILHDIRSKVYKN